MAKLVDALVSGTSVRKDVQVRVLFWAQTRGCLISFFKALKIEYLKNYSGRSTNKKRVSLTFETPSYFFTFLFAKNRWHVVCCIIQLFRTLYHFWSFPASLFSPLKNKHDYLLKIYSTCFLFLAASIINVLASQPDEQPPEQAVFPSSGKIIFQKLYMV